MKEYCTGSHRNAENIVDDRTGDRLGQCPVCKRVLVPLASGKLRMHSVRGPNTRSHDVLMGRLYAISLRTTSGGRP